MSTSSTFNVVLELESDLVQFQAPQRTRSSNRKRASLLLLRLTMSAANSLPQTPGEEAQFLLPPQPKSKGTFQSAYARLQAATGGYLLFIIGLSVLAVSVAVLFLPQTYWNRLIMTLTGCVTVRVGGKEYNFCQKQEQQNAQVPLI